MLLKNHGQTPRVWYDTAILLIAPTKAAVRKVSIFGFALNVSLISWYERIIVSSKPEFTNSSSEAPFIILERCIGVKATPVIPSTMLTRLRLVFSSKRLFMRPKATCDRFLSHSKYDTVTPPALAYMSGMMIPP